MDRLDRTVGPEDRNGVVLRDEPDRESGCRARQCRVERGGHAGDSALDLEARTFEQVGEAA